MEKREGDIPGFLLGEIRGSKKGEFRGTPEVRDTFAKGTMTLPGGGGGGQRREGLSVLA